MTTKVYKKFRDIEPVEQIAPGTALCAGCGGLEGLRLAMKVLGDRVLICNSAGCFTLLSVYPFTPFQGSWLYTTMGDAVPGAQGVRDALDIRKQLHGLPQSEDMQVMVVSGDGATSDIGFGPASAGIHRNLDFIYFCYDNEAYGNTGFQMSPMSPYGSETQTSSHTGLHPAGTEQGKKDLFEIWKAHKPAYIATVTPREPMDLSNKFEKAKNIKGPRLFLCMAPCPTGWGFDPRETHRIAKLAVDTGVFPLKEYFEGKTVHTRIPRKRLPAEEYLKTQKRFRHLFAPERRDDVIGEIQRRVDAYWEACDD